ncbi:MAG TPA: PA14 domain-containing protein, partial [Candidatus Limnocylindrales bacterium]|nr:PA14 domain-containing protein [Candidatus Limnocylindrales bacterium]
MQVKILKILPSKKELGFYLLCLILISLGAYGLERRFRIPYGLEGKYYANPRWQGTPQFEVLDPEISTEQLKERRSRFSENRFSILWKGFIAIERPGLYTFATASDDGSDLFINDQRVVDNGGEHGLEEVRGQIYLEAGIYPIRIRYFQAGGHYRMDLFWARQDQPLESLPSYVLTPQPVTYRNYKLNRIATQLVTLIKFIWLGTAAYLFWLYPFKWISRFVKSYHQTLARSFLYELGGITLLLGFLLILFFYDVVFLDYSLLTGGTALKPHHVIDPAASALQHEPFIKVASQTYKSGWIPLWNPHSATGSPLNADMHTGVFFPFHLPLFLNPTAKTWDAFMILRILSAGVLSYAFFRKFLNLQKLPAFFGASAFMLCGHLILNLNMVYINAVVLLPGLLYVSERLLQTLRLKNLLLVAILVGLIILGGHPESTFFALFYGSMYYLFRIIQEIRSRKSKVESPGFSFLVSCTWFTVAILLGFLLSSIMLLPFLEFVKIGNVGLHEAKYRVGLLGAPLSHIFDLWVPYFWGPINDAWDGANWQYLPGYMGMVVAIMVATLFLQGFAFRGKALFFTTMVIFFLVKGYNLSTTFNNFIGNLPAFRVSFFTRYFPGEFMFSTAALAGLFLQQLIDGRIRTRYLTLSILLGLASLALLLGLYYPDLLKQHKGDYAVRQILPPVILCLLATVGTGLLGRKWSADPLSRLFAHRLKFPTLGSLPSHKILATFLGLLLIIELFIWLPKAHYKRSDLSLFTDPAPYIKFIQQDPGVFRIYGLDGFFYPNTASGYGLDDIGSLNALFNARYIDFSLKLIRPYVGYFEGYNVPNVENRFFSFLNLKYLVTAPWTPPPAPFFTLVYQQEANVYRNEQAFP